MGLNEPIPNITLPLPHFLKYFWSKTIQSGFMTERVGLKEEEHALATLFSLLDPKENYYHLEPADKENIIWVYPIKEWRTSGEKRANLQRLRQLEWDAKVKTAEYAVEILNAMQKHPVFGAFTKEQLYFLSCDILKKKNLKKAAELGVIIPESEMLVI